LRPSPRFSSFQIMSSVLPVQENPLLCASQRVLFLIIEMMVALYTDFISIVHIIIYFELHERLLGFLNRCLTGQKSSLSNIDQSFHKE